MKHYHTERNHQGLEHALVAGKPEDEAGIATVVRHEKLGGLLNFYRRETA